MPPQNSKKTPKYVTTAPIPPAPRCHTGPQLDKKALLRRGYKEPQALRCHLLIASTPATPAGTEGKSQHYHRNKHIAYASATPTQKLTHASAAPSANNRENPTVPTELRNRAHPRHRDATHMDYLKITLNHT